MRRNATLQTPHAIHLAGGGGDFQPWYKCVHVVECTWNQSTGSILCAFGNKDDEGTDEAGHIQTDDMLCGQILCIKKIIKL
jgi:hypothetical protein